jgi:serine/threonine-protein kinase
LSPDGRWLAYDSRVSGRSEVYVMPMPKGGSGADSLGAGGRWQVSAEGGDNPMWSRDGRELFYKRLDDVMVAVAVDGRGQNFQAVSERPMFQAFQRGSTPTFDVSADGSRFMVVTSSTERQAPLVVVTNWTRTLAAR